MQFSRVGYYPFLSVHRHTFDFLKACGLSFFSSKSYYEILNVPRNATSKQIKDHFYRLSKKCHPDKHQGSREAHKNFQEINEAYSTLIDPRKRLIYDQELGGPRETTKGQAQYSPKENVWNARANQTKSNSSNKTASYRRDTLYEIRYARWAIKQEENRRNKQQPIEDDRTNEDVRNRASMDEQESPVGPAIDRLRLRHLLMLLGCIGCGFHLIRQWKSRS